VIVSTTGCAGSDHPEIRVVVSRAGVPSVDVAWMIGHLEETVAAGTRYAPGETVQIGWMLTQVIERDDGHLGLTEPDMRSLPIVWVDDVSETLGHLRLQRDVADGLGVAPQFPSIRESLVLGTDLDPASSALVLDRLPGEGFDSGWFLGDLRSELRYDGPDDLRRTSLYEAALSWPAIIPYLALPPGSRIELDDGEVNVALADGSAG
jgi:hypothetical protein